MWYQQFHFFDTQPGRTAPPEPGYLSAPFTAAEKEACQLAKISPALTATDPLCMPQELYLPEELLQLLLFSDGGGIINGEREFGYFSLDEIRTFYFSYGFPEWAPLFLPVALNGGGVFYAYDFREAPRLRVVAVSAGNLGYEDAVVLGNSLEETLRKTTNIENELYGS